MSQRASSLLDRFFTEKIRFGVVGVINTLVDFGVLMLLAVVLGIPVVIANIVSTSCAMTVSFLLNKHTVFKDTGRNKRRQIALFLLVTMSGIWLLQSLLIIMLVALFDILFVSVDDAALLFVAKAIATVASLCWNYIGYKHFVFRKKDA